MTSPNKIRANRQNARRSTGPKSEAGKKRVAQNAHRHGLAVPIGLIPSASETAERLARLIADSDKNPERLEGARRVAEAEIDLIRVRAVRIGLLRGTIKDQYRHSNRRTRLLLRVMMKRYAVSGDLSLPEEMLGLVDPIPPSEITDAERLVIRLGEIAVELARLDRYERRALSRRRSAVRAYENRSLAAPPTTWKV